MSVLDPAVVGAIDDLELVARLIVEGTRAGQHRSPFHGFSTEFSQHRQYRPGDDFRHLDWKLLARTGRLYTRQFRETTNMSVMLILDASGSMAFPDSPRRARHAGTPAPGTKPQAPGPELSKFRYAVLLAAALSYLIVTEGDRVGLMAASGDSWTYLPARGGRPHLRALLARLERLEPARTWQPAPVIARAADLLERRGLVIVLSDFYDAEDDTLRELRRVARRGHEVTMLQIVSRRERTFDYRGPIEFEDVETGAVRLVDAETVAAGYRAGIDAFLDRWKQRARLDGIDYARFTTDEPPDRALRTYLIQRGSALHASHGPSEARR
jgi:uncharacterized protein (DUF58 family)